MIEREPGTRNAPAAPWRTRAAMRTSIDGAAPQSADVAPNATSPRVKTRRRPVRSVTAPATSRRAAREKR